MNHSKFSNLPSGRRGVYNSYYVTTVVVEVTPQFDVNSVTKLLRAVTEVKETMCLEKICRNGSKFVFFWNYVAVQRTVAPADPNGVLEHSLQLLYCRGLISAEVNMFFTSIVYCSNCTVPK